MSVAAALITALFLMGPSTTIICGEVIEVLLVLLESPVNATAEASALAVEHVNSNANILPDDQLQVIPRYLKCSSVDVIQELLDFEANCSNGSSVFCGRMVISGGCTLHSEVISLLSSQLNVIQINYLPLGPTLGRSLAGSNYFTLLETVDSVILTQLALLQALGAKEVTVLVEEEPSCIDGWSSVGNLTSLVFGIKAEVVFLTDRPNVTQTMQDLTTSYDPRSILVCAGQETLQLIACEAAKRGMVYPHFLWLVPDWTSSQWLTADSGDCSAEQIGHFINRVIAVTAIYESDKVDQILDVTELPTNPSLTSVPERLAYDSVWTVASTLDEARKRARPTARKERVASILQDELWEISLMGTSGLVEFVNMTGQRKNNGMRATVYILDSNNTITPSNLATVTGSLRTSPEVTFLTDWANIYYDGLPTKPTQLPSWFFEVPTESIVLYSVFLLLVAAGVVYAVVCILFSLCLMNDSEIKLTSPKLNVFLGMGAICWYLTIALGWPPWPQEPVFVTIHCELQKWLLSLGATLLLIPLILKTWRIYYIFHNPLKQKIALQDWKLMIALGLTVLVDLVCLTVTTAVDRWRLSAFVEEGVVTCGSEEAFLVNYIVFATFNTVYSIVGLILACQTRKIRLKGINESPQVSLASYIFAFSLFAYVVTAYLTRPKQILALGIVGSVLFGSATLILSVIFIPKFYIIATRKEVNENATFDTEEGIDGLRKATLAAMESELQQLRSELAECRNNMSRQSAALRSTAGRHRSGTNPAMVEINQESQTSLTIIEE